MGWGVGKDFVVRRAGNNAVWEAGGFHNIAFDLLVRSGAAGLVAFVIALTLSLRQGIHAWRAHPDPRVAAVALAAVAVVTGLVAKGLAESILEKSRLAISLGILMGFAARAAFECHERDDPQPLVLPDDPAAQDRWPSPSLDTP